MILSQMRTIGARASGIVSRCQINNNLTRRNGHTVRIILKKDLPPKGYASDTIEVRAGFARNKLIPTKHAVYATPENYEKLGMVDPEILKVKKKKETVKLSEEEVADKNAAYVLRTYLRDKVLEMKRNALEDGTTHPGMVDAAALREKLSKQLMIDLEEHEKITIDDLPVKFSELKIEDDDLPLIPLDDVEKCTVELKKLGEYIATIHLSGGFQIPLKFHIIKR